MIACRACGKASGFVAQILPYCPDCIRAKSGALQDDLLEIHKKTRVEYKLPIQPPRTEGGKVCQQCVNRCKMAEGERGYCGVRQNLSGKIKSSGRDWAYLEFYHDPLPTNCVAAWVCPGCSKRGFPKYSDFNHAEFGYKNLAVFYEGCSFNCLFCQNWSFKERQVRTTVEELVGAVDPLTSCICFFGGDPGPFAEHTLEVADRILKKGKKTFRICWETNGSVSGNLMTKMAEYALVSGGSIKIDFKAYTEEMHLALCGASNENTKENIKLLGRLAKERADSPLLIISTLLVPGYIDLVELQGVAGFISGIDRKIPWSLLGFHPQFKMTDLPCTSRAQAQQALEIAKKFGLEDINIGNAHLLA